MWKAENCNRSNRAQEICPFLLADKDKRWSADCVHEKCAWYVAERRECAVKVIATR